MKKEYSNGELTVIWQAEKCVHAGMCVKMLPEVYDPNARPWIAAENASTDALREQIDQCPSGALTYRMNDEEMTEKKTDSPDSILRASLVENGPLMISGTLLLKRADGSDELREGNTAFCRCGVSQNKPYCDGSHNQTAFKG